MEHNCLNCDQQLTGNYCQHCGQKSTTHRYSLKHFIEHDIIHGVWHVDKGILFTIKVLFTKPGHSVREFIQGKRGNLFNFISLIVLILAASSFLSHYTHIKLTDLMPEKSKAIAGPIEKFTTNYPKIVLLITIPIYSLFSFIWFRKVQLNFTEHLVLNSYKTSGELIIALLFTVITIFYTNIKVLFFIYYFIILLSFIYSIWFYYQFFSKYQYSKKSLIFRVIMVPVSYMLISTIVGIVTAVIKILSH